MNAPAHWEQAQAYRACAICTHGAKDPTDPHRPVDACRCPAVTGNNQRTVAISQARANFGPCGPEAQHLAFPGLGAR